MSADIVIFIRSLNVGGAERQSIYLTKELSKRYNVILIVLNKEGGFVEEVEQSLENVLFLKGNMFSKIYQLYIFLKRNKTQFLFNYLPVNNILGGVIGKLAGVEYIFNGIRGNKIHNNILKMKLQRFVSNRIVYKTISNSHKAKEVYVKYGFKAEKIIVIHNMTTYEPKEIQVSSKADVIQLLTVGRFVEEKGYDTLLLALHSLLNRTSKKWQLTIIGYGVLQNKILQMIEELELTNYIKIVSESSKLVKYYNESDIYISTSRFEGMSNTIMEAMSHGLPVICTKAGDSDQLVTNEVNGMICEIDNHQNIANQILRLIESDKERYSYGIESLNKIKQSFTPESISIEYIKLIEAK